MPLVPGGSRAVSPEWRTGRQYPLAHGPSVAHGPSDPSGTRTVNFHRRTGRQRLTGRQVQVAHGPSIPAGARAVSPHVAHGPSVRTWLTGRQSPVGARAVSPRVSPGSSGSWPVGRRFSVPLGPRGGGGVCLGRYVRVLVGELRRCLVRPPPYGRGAHSRGVGRDSCGQVTVASPGRWSSPAEPAGCVSAAARRRACVRPGAESPGPLGRCLVRPPSSGRSSHTRARHLLAPRLLPTRARASD